MLSITWYRVYTYIYKCIQFPSALCKVRSCSPAGYMSRPKSVCCSGFDSRHTPDARRNVAFPGKCVLVVYINTCCYKLGTIDRSTVLRHVLGLANNNQQLKTALCTLISEVDNVRLFACQCRVQCNVIKVHKLINAGHISVKLL